jgi:hypothetical protein
MVGAVTVQTIPSTPIVDLYDQLHARGVGRERRLALARGYAAIPGALAALFGDSVKRLADYPTVDELFWDGARTATPGKPVTRTHHLALRLEEAKSCDVAPGARAFSDLPPGVQEVPADKLAFAYIDRELVPSRSTTGLKTDGTAVRLDLLLANAADGTAIVGEVKIGTDKDPFAALVQALACGAQLVSTSQYARLRKHAKRERDDIELRQFTGPPSLDLYLVLHAFPEATYLPELLTETERISAQLLASPRVRLHIRRIACLLTEEVEDKITAQRGFAFEHMESAA